MIRVFKMQSQSAFNIISPAPEADKSYIMLEGFFQRGIEQEEISAWHIVFKTQRGGKLELVVAHHGAGERRAADDV